MFEANAVQIAQFKKNYCQNKEKRLSIKEYFTVEIESFEELLPGSAVKSYATGNRDIENGFIVFRVTSAHDDTIYHPVFSETVGRELVRAWELELPSKMSVFTSESNKGVSKRGSDEEKIRRKDSNRKMLLLIQFARSMMILHVDEPEPMREPFKGIYIKLEKNPQYDAWESDIKSINTAIANFLRKPINTKHENFANLQGYIAYLQENYSERHLRSFDFEMLRDKMQKRYPVEKIIF